MPKESRDPPSAPANSIGTFYTTAEVARMFKTTVRSLQRWIEAGEIQAFLIGGGYRIHEDDVKRFLEGRRGQRIRRKGTDKKKGKHEQDASFSSD